MHRESLFQPESPTDSLVLSTSQYMLPNGIQQQLLNLLEMISFKVVTISPLHSTSVPAIYVNLVNGITSSFFLSQSWKIYFPQGFSKIYIIDGNDSPKMCEASDALICMTVCYFVIHFKDLENVGYDHPGLPIFQARDQDKTESKASGESLPKPASLCLGTALLFQ